MSLIKENPKNCAGFFLQHRWPTIYTVLKQSILEWQLTDCSLHTYWLKWQTSPTAGSFQLLLMNCKSGSFCCALRSRCLYGTMEPNVLKDCIWYLLLQWFDTGVLAVAGSRHFLFVPGLLLTMWTDVLLDVRQSGFLLPDLVKDLHKLLVLSHCTVCSSIQWVQSN